MPRSRLYESDGVPEHAYDYGDEGAEDTYYDYGEEEPENEYDYGGDAEPEVYNKTESKLQSIEALPGQTIQFDCPSSNAKWTYVDTKTKKRKQVHDDDDDDSTLTVNNVKLNDEGVYTCHYHEQGVRYIKDAGKLAVRLFTGKLKIILLINFSTLNIKKINYGKQMFIDMAYNVAT